MWVRVKALLVNFVMSVHSIVSFAAVIRVVTRHATLLPTSGKERCVTSDDPNNGREGDYAQY